MLPISEQWECRTCSSWVWSQWLTRTIHDIYISHVVSLTFVKVSGKRICWIAVSNFENKRRFKFPVNGNSEWSLSRIVSNFVYNSKLGSLTDQVGSYGLDVSRAGTFVLICEELSQTGDWNSRKVSTNDVSRCRVIFHLYSVECVS
jgi:hypothetical protein